MSVDSKFASAKLGGLEATFAKLASGEIREAAGRRYSFAVVTRHESRNMVGRINAQLRSVSRNQGNAIPCGNRDRYYHGACIASRRSFRFDLGEVCVATR